MSGEQVYDFDYDIATLPKCYSFHEVPISFTGVCIVKQWMCHIKDGRKHKKNGPAIKCISVRDGYSIYEWWVNGDNHRLDGYAMIYSEKYKDQNSYWILDHQYCEKEYLSHPLVFQHKINRIINETL